MWNPVQSKNLEYYFIKDYNNIKMASNLYSKRTNFWRNIPIRTHTIKP